MRVEASYVARLDFAILSLSFFFGGVYVTMADQAAEAVDLASKQDGQVGVRAAAGSASIVRAADCSARRAPPRAISTRVARGPLMR